MDTETRNDNRHMLLRLVVGAVVMFGFGYLLVPFYEKLCEVTGLNNILQAQKAPANTQVDRSRLVTIEFDANTQSKLPWKFRPKQNVLKVHPGELTTVSYEVTNERDYEVTGQAVPSYGPKLAGNFFLKMDCFCFTQQTLKAGETRDMPVAFLIDPKLPDDVNTIALSYTFFAIEGRAAVDSKVQPGGG